MLKTILYTLLLIALFALISGVWASYPIWFNHVLSLSGNKETLSQLGTIGDAFGALNTLFSGLAFAGIIVSIVLQSRELKDTRRELKEQKDQFVIQNASLKRQVFENTFFQLLHLHNEIVGAIRVRIGHFENAREVIGRAAVGALFNQFISREHHHHFPGEEKPKNRIDDYDLFHSIHHETIGHYFRNIYQILKFVDESSVDNKRFYTNLLRAQLSSDELGLLFYNCLSKIGVEKFKPLLERYALLEHLPRYNVIAESEVQLYKGTVFGDSSSWNVS